MRAWLSLLGGLIIWAGHFLAAYAIASLADIARPEHRQPLLLLLVGLTVLCVLTAVALALRAWRAFDRTLPEGAFARRLSAAGAVIAAVAILWQTAPVYWSFL
ncbi:hypothetical protein AS593_06995 [Caulobacter vibrioides]|nr:hypothetical protein AS593_06995 [Caulobacter vibrioides]